jgi:hypothetical protein
MEGIVKQVVETDTDYHFVFKNSGSKSTTVGGDSEEGADAK